MFDKINSIETDADDELAWIAAPADEQIDNLMHTTHSEDKRANYGNDADSMTTIARGKMKDLITEDAHRIYAECTQAEVQT